MAYRKTPYRVLTGGLSLLPPNDKVDAAHSLVLQNFTVEAGRLRSRNGITSTGSLSGKVHTIYRYQPGSRYFGAGTALYRGGSSIATGLDGSRVGIAASNGWVWAMNRSKQVKDDGTNTFNWGVDAPGTAPSAASRSKSYVTISSFDNTETWEQIAPDGTSSTPIFDSSNAVLGDSMRIAADAEGTWQARRTYGSPTDLGISSQQKDEDEITLWVFCSNPAALTALSLAIDVNGGDFKDDYYTCDVDVKQLNQTAYSWNALRIQRKLTPEAVLAGNSEYADLVKQEQDARDAGDDARASALAGQIAILRDNLLANASGFTRYGSTSGKDWTTAKALRVQFATTGSVDVHFDQWQVGGDTVAALNGTYQFAVTFDTDANHESNPGPWSDPVEAKGTGINLTSIPTSADGQVTKRHIYVRGGSLGRSWRAWTINNNSTTTLTYYVSDEDAQNLGFQLERDHGLDHDPPPPARGLVGPYFGKLVAFSSAEHPGRYWWTKTSQPWFFPGSDDDLEGNWEDTGLEAEEILAVTQHRGMLIFYKESSIWRLIGDPDSADPQLLTEKYSPVGASAVASSDLGDFFVGHEAVFSFNGEIAVDISREIAPIFRSEYVQVGGTDYNIPPMDVTNRDQCVLEVSGGKLYLSYPEVGQSAPNIVLVLDIATGNWSHFKYGVGSGGFTALHNEGTRRAVVAGTSSGGVFDLDGGADDNTNAVPAVWMSGYLDMGLPDNPKRVSDLVIDYKTAGPGQSAATMTAKLYYDNGASNEAIGSLSSATRTKARFRLGTDGMGKQLTNVAVFLEGSIHATVEIFGVYLHYYPEPRAALSFDTGTLDSGTELVKRITEFEVEVETTANLTYHVWGDIPGPFEDKVSGTITNQSGVRTVRVVLSNPVEGFRNRITFTSSGAFQLYRLRARVLTYGQFIDGAAGGVFETEDIAYGI